MPLGTQIPGDVFVILVGTASPATVPVGGLQSWDYPSEAPSTTHKYYGMPNYVSRGKKSATMTFTCQLLTGDSGQQLLLAAWISGNTIYAIIKQGATHGEELPVKVTSRSLSGPDPDNPSTVTFALGQQTDATVVGTGYGT